MEKNKKMEDILRRRIRENVSKEGKIILKNNFKYNGKITNFDENYIEILDYRTNEYHVLRYDEVKDFVRSAK